MVRHPVHSRSVARDDSLHVKALLMNSFSVEKKPDCPDAVEFLFEVFTSQQTLHRTVLPQFEPGIRFPGLPCLSNLEGMITLMLQLAPRGYPIGC